MKPETEKLLLQLAEKFNTTVEHLWTVLLKQAFISSITNIVVGILLVTTIVISYKKTLQWRDKLKSHDDPDTAMFFIWLVWSLFALGSVCFICANAEYTIAGLFNPEFLAIRLILNQ